LRNFEKPAVPARVAPRPGTPPRIVQTCRNSILNAAKPYGVLRADVVSAGEAKRGARGMVTAPVLARITYARQGGNEVRQSRVTCRLNAKGLVVALSS
jgi:hypothetical protein